jgi:hypothetical protein
MAVAPTAAHPVDDVQKGTTVVAEEVSVAAAAEREAETRRYECRRVREEREAVVPQELSIEALRAALEERRRRIAVTSEDVAFLTEVFRCTARMVRGAVSYERDSNLAQRIRLAARQHGCAEVWELPVVETLHDANGCMVQTLGNGVLLVFSKQFGWCRVFAGNRLVRQYDEVRVCDIEAIQQWAGSLPVKHVTA